MKKRLLSILMTVAILLSMAVPTFAAPSDGEKTNVVYLGVQGYGTFSCKTNSSPFDTTVALEDMVHRFFVNGAEETYLVSSENNYALQNLLNDGYVYDITVKDGVVVAASAAQGVEGTASAVSAGSITVDGRTIPVASGAKAYAIDATVGHYAAAEIDLASVKDKTVKVYGNPAQVIYQTFVAEPITYPVSYTPGLRTIKNYLAAALQPVGTALYVYGGTWDWQDDMSSPQALTIGVPQTWIDFFQAQDIDFSYRSYDDYTSTTYQYGKWNQYHFAGVDCSGYVGWSVYNVMNTESFQEDTGYYVGGSNTRAKKLADAGFGTWSRDFFPSDFKPGDIMSMSGHCWICIGTCSDGSLVILHSTPSDNRNGTGNGGGGVQISGVSDKPNSEAYQLAKFYMEKYYPEWSSRYPAVQRGSSYYTNMSNSNNGRFTWTIGEAGLTDPDGYLSMGAEQVLKDLFGEETDVLANQSPAVRPGTAVKEETVAYLGVEDYGTYSCSTSSRFDMVIDKSAMRHRFYINGVEESYLVSSANNYALQNVLNDGYVYNITVQNGIVTAASPAKGVEGTASAVSANSITVNGETIPVADGAKAYAINAAVGHYSAKEIDLTSVNGKTVKVYGNPAQVIYQTFVAEPYTPPVSYTPGLRTVKNYLAASLQPVGTALYVYGGGWDWQDSMSSRESLSIGLPQNWVDFFQSQDIDYNYRDNNDYTSTTYQFGLWNQYNFAGPDCSGYVGWTVYNVLNTESYLEDTGYYVAGSRGGANSRAIELADAGFGEWTRDFFPSDFKPGDIMSMSGHCWICIGTCSDGSLVILHSTPSDNLNGTGNGGGGVQISGVSDIPNSEAYQLAKFYMEKYFPEWSSRYPAVQKGTSYYTNMSNKNNGKFTWTIGEAGLTDPDGYLSMGAEQVLKDLFGESANVLANQGPAKPAEPSEPTPSSDTYTAVAGDTWNTVALNAYGSYTYAAALQKANPAVKGALKAGTVITLPETLGKAARLPAQTLGTGESYYVVKAGDTLGSIAKAAYGDANRYQDIYQRNTDRLTSANRIYTGQILVLPAK